MNYGQIKLTDVANGPGMRVTLFVSGCTNHCKGCFQPETWDPDYGVPYTKETEDFLIKELQKPYYEGITLLGGEPFEPENQKELIHLVKRIRKELPEKTIWAYTGFTLEELQPECPKYTDVTMELLKNMDILVDGRFLEEEKDIRLTFKGSRNQRIIDLKKTLECDKVVLSELN